MTTSHSRISHSAIVGLTALLLGLSGCGGGGGGGGGGGQPAPPAPSNLVYSATSRLEISQVEIEPITATFLGTVTSFTVVPPLPAGLVIDNATGAISGAANSPAPRRDYDVAASNAGGSAHFMLTLEVVPAARFLYATSPTDRSISFFANDVLTGETTRAGQSVTSVVESQPERLVFHQNGRFAYSPNMATGNVTTFTIDSDTGALAAQGTVPCAVGPHAMAIDPTGRFAYVTNQGSDLLHQFSIDQVTGALTQIGLPVVTSIQPSDVRIEPTGHLLYITLRGRDTDGLGSSVQGFTIDPVSGQLTATWPSQFLLGGRPSSLSIDPLKPVLYVTLEWFDSALPIRFDPVTGLLTPVALRHAGVLPLSISVHASGKFAYLVNQGDDTVVAYSIHPVNYGLMTVGTYPTGVAPTSITLDSTGKFAYVAAKDSAEVITYAINGSTGALTEQGRMRTRGSPSHVALGPGDHPTVKVPRFVHVAGRASGDVTSYTIDAATGALAQTSVTPTGNRPSSIAIDPLRRFAWIANEDSGTISIRTLDEVTGALAGFLPDQVVAGSPTHLAVEPTGRFLYSVAHSVVLPEDGWLTAWSIGANGALTAIGSTEVGTNPGTVVIEPTGHFVYTVERGTGAPGSAGVSVFSIDMTTGAVVSAGAPVGAPGIVDLVFHPRGYEACGVFPGANELASYEVGLDGSLTLVPPATVAGPEPYGMAFTPLGQFAYVASRGFAGAGNIALHVVSGGGGIDAASQVLQDGTQPTAIAVDPTGAFAYAINAGSDTVSVARLDAETGVMVLLPPVGTGVEPGAIAVTGVTQ